MRLARADDERGAAARIFCDIGHVSVVFGLRAQSAAACEGVLALSAR